MLQHLLRDKDYSDFLSKMEVFDSMVINFLFQHRVCKLDKEIDQKLTLAIEFFYEAKLLSEKRLSKKGNNEKG